MNDFDVSSDLTITNGAIDASSLFYEGNGTYRFTFSLNQENQVSQISLGAGNVSDRYGEPNEGCHCEHPIDVSSCNPGSGFTCMVAF